MSIPQNLTFTDIVELVERALHSVTNSTLSLAYASPKTSKHNLKIQLLTEYRSSVKRHEIPITLYQPLVRYERDSCYHLASFQRTLCSTATTLGCKHHFAVRFCSFFLTQVLSKIKVGGFRTIQPILIVCLSSITSYQITKQVCKENGKEILLEFTTTYFPRNT